MITLTQEPFDSAVAARLVYALQVEIYERYDDAMLGMSDAERARDVVEMVAEVSADMVRAPHGTFLVAWLEGEPVSCGAVKPLDPEARIGEVKRMYTVPAARRQGLSRAVLSALEQRAAELGYKALQLETGTAQPEALALYEAQGWHRIVPYGRYRDEPDCVCFAKDLSTA